MADEKLLATFRVEETGDVFNIYGEYDIKQGSVVDIIGDSKLINFNYPDFYDITATKVIDGKEESFKPVGETWAGHKYECMDMIHAFISSIIIGNNVYSKIYLDAKLQKIVDSYTNDSEVALTVSGRKIPKRILSYNMYDMYQLLLVTDAFIYYNYEESVYMLGTDDHNVVSDNYFAEVGLADSIENVKSGKEMLLWGELPEGETIEIRTVTLSDGTGMGDNLYVFKTNAPIAELKKLEEESCKVYLEGRDSSEVPIWADVLTEKGYCFDYVAEHQHVNPYDTSSGWLEKNYPDITEHYVIENQPELK